VWFFPRRKFALSNNEVCRLWASAALKLPKKACEDFLSQYTQWREIVRYSEFGCDSVAFVVSTNGNNGTVTTDTNVL
jgi:hypothetical protein